MIVDRYATVCAKHAAKLGVELVGLTTEAVAGSDVSRQGALLYIRMLREELIEVEALLNGATKEAAEALAHPKVAA